MVKRLTNKLSYQERTQYAQKYLESQQIKETKKIGVQIASMVVGISSLVFFFWIFGWVGGIAIGLACHNWKEKEGHGFAIAGLVTGIVAVASFLGFWFLCLCLATAGY